MTVTTRTTASDVRLVLDSDLGDEACAHAIAVAAHLVAPVETSLGAGDALSADDEDLLARLQTYVAAHIATVTDPTVTHESFEATSFDYAAETTYGDVALMLDPTGDLSLDPHGSDTPLVGLWTPDAKHIQGADDTVTGGDD